MFEVECEEELVRASVLRGKHIACDYLGIEYEPNQDFNQIEFTPDEMKELGERFHSISFGKNNLPFLTENEIKLFAISIESGIEEMGNFDE